MTKSGANEIAADLNKNLLHGSPYSAKIVKPLVGNVRGSGYTVGVYAGEREIVAPQNERRALNDLARKAVRAWNPHCEALRPKSRFF
jgi:hypothetical protein